MLDVGDAEETPSIGEKDTVQLVDLEEVKSLEATTGLGKRTQAGNVRNNRSLL